MKSNVDADTLSHLPLDIENYTSCTEEFTSNLVCAVWDGSKVAKKKTNLGLWALTSRPKNPPPLLFSSTDNSNKP